MNKMIEIKGTEKEIKTAMSILEAMGLMVTEAQPKAETVKAKATKQSKKSSTSKTEDDFPRTEYIAMAKAIGCLSKKGTVWNSCRSIVYDAIGWEPETKTVGKPRLTKAAAKKAVDKVKKDNGWS